MGNITTTCTQTWGTAPPPHAPSDIPEARATPPPTPQQPHSIRILAARPIVLSHPRAHWVSGDRPLRCIRVPIRDAPPPPETRGYVWRGVGRGLVNKHAFFLLLGLRVGRAGGRRPTVEGRAWGGPTGGRASEANMDRHYYRYPLSGADQITYVVFRGRAILHMTCGGAQL